MYEYLLIILINSTLLRTISVQPTTYMEGYIMTANWHLEIELEYSLTNYNLATLYCCAGYESLDSESQIINFKNHNFINSLSIQSAKAIVQRISKELGDYGFKRSMYLASNKSLNKIIKNVTATVFDQRFKSPRTDVSIKHNLFIFDLARFYCIQFFCDRGDQVFKNKIIRKDVINRSKLVNKKSIIELAGAELRDYGYIRSDFLHNKNVLQPLFESVAFIFKKNMFSE